jgi:hypothetical protein
MTHGTMDLKYIHISLTFQMAAVQSRYLGKATKEGKED